MQRLSADTALLHLGWPAPLDANGYVHDDGEVTLVDTGLRYPRRSLREELADAGYSPAEVDRVLLTHYDLDHTGGLDYADLDAPVYLGRLDADLVAGRWDPPLAHPKGWVHRVARELFPLPEDADLRIVDDGDRIGGFTAHHTPGHNPGHTTYVHEDGVAFVGDLLWETDGELELPFWGDSYDRRRMRESVRDLVARAEPFDAIYMGHGIPFTSGGAARLRDFAARLT
ncbi:MBL fold metallo-hydrolase [Halomarina halobia]|uniref:MBL fold metallo-hydrolase n=1 Tax=Halomarina halobia TaxID=3033386 RepID=A0ABD6A5L8_9EURY|nr:MBL fold metallo-hydrolase [Halomarina sp. PSR21]